MSFLPDTSVQEIEDNYKKFMKRDDIDIILINQNVSVTVFSAFSLISCCRVIWLWLRPVFTHSFVSYTQ